MLRDGELRPLDHPVEELGEFVLGLERTHGDFSGLHNNRLV
jgi:hypothetical protein